MHEVTQASWFRDAREWYLYKQTMLTIHRRHCN